MFNLVEMIERHNQMHQTKIKPNKTWGLKYLQPESLDFLNKHPQLIKQSSYYASPFVSISSDRKALRAALAKTKDQSIRESIPIFKNIIQQLKADHPILERLNWEKSLARFLSQNVWEQRFNQAKAENDTKAQQRILQACKQWNTHVPFQYHSSEGLLFVLEVIVEYRHHFLEACKELEAKQKAWIPSMRLPPSIAKDYEYFLRIQANKLFVLKGQVIDALLLRLKSIESRNQVTCDDVSYIFAENMDLLGLPPVTLPTYQFTLDSATFNRMQRAIEKDGDVDQQTQLYELNGYKHSNYTLITLLPHCLFIPNNMKKLIGFFSNRRRLQFLEAQQALLAQFSFPIEFENELARSITLSENNLQILMTRYQLLQQSLQLLKQQQPTRWWQWQQKRWNKAWEQWLIEHFKKNQKNLSDYCADLYIVATIRKNILDNTTFCQEVQNRLKAIQSLMIHDNPENKSESLKRLVQNVSLLFENKVSLLKNTDNVCVSPSHTPPRKKSSDTESIDSSGSDATSNQMIQLQEEINTLQEDNTYRHRA